MSIMSSNPMLEVKYVVLSVNTFKTSYACVLLIPVKFWRYIMIFYVRKGSLRILLIKRGRHCMIVLTRLSYVTNSMIISSLLLTILMIVSLPLINLPLSIWATGYIINFSTYLPLVMRCKNYFPLLFPRDSISNQFPCLSTYLSPVISPIISKFFNIIYKLSN